MNQLTREWLEKAEGDWVTAGRELRARNNPNYDAACFHSQQCAGKYLKGRLQEEGIRFSKIHDLEILLDLLLPVESGWDVLRPQMKVLKVYEVGFRYPGASADKPMAKQAVQFCQDIREAVRSSLGLAI